MIAKYKTHAKDLYEIKLAIACKPKIETIASLNTFLENIHCLRPVLRLELQQLLKEFNESHEGITLAEALAIRLINSHYIIKLQREAKHVSKKIRRLEN